MKFICIALLSSHLFLRRLSFHCLWHTEEQGAICDMKQWGEHGERRYDVVEGFSCGGVVGQWGRIFPTSLCKIHPAEDTSMRSFNIFSSAFR